MVTVACPWCEAELWLDTTELDGAQLECGHCCTAWSLGEPLAEMPLAA